MLGTQAICLYVLGLKEGEELVRVAIGSGGKGLHSHVLDTQMGMERRSVNHGFSLDT
jgi:hypothetical protein